MKRALALVAAVVVIALPTHDALAQCQGGRVVSAATAGRCCWPEQSWNDERGRCEGPPACPAGMTATGDDCVGTAAVGATPDVTIAPSSPVVGPLVAPMPAVPVVEAGGWPPAPPSGPAGARSFTVEHSSNTALTVAGALMLGLGYAAAVAICAPIAGKHGSAGYALIPFAHWAGAFGATDQAQSTPIVLFGAGFALVEAVGLALALLGRVGPGGTYLEFAGHPVRLGASASSDGAALMLAAEL